MERLWTGRNEKSNRRRLGRFVRMSGVSMCRSDGWDDIGGGKETAQNFTETFAYEVVASPFGDLSAVEDMLSLGVDGGTTNAGWKG